MDDEINDLPMNLRKAFFHRVSLDKSESARELADRLWDESFERRPIDELPVAVSLRNIDGEIELLSVAIVQNEVDGYCRIQTSEDNE